MTESGVLWAVALLIVIAIFVPQWVAFRRRLRSDRERKEEATALGIDQPAAQFPYIDPEHCIGCGACVRACPEGDVLGIVGGTAVVVNGLRCVGHGRCEDACPVEAIEVGVGDLKSRRDVPLLSDDLETTVPGIFVAGELGGLALVRNAVLQGRRAIDAARVRLGEPGGDEGVLDLAIIGAGPAGLSAALTARAQGLSYVVFEREATLGGSLLHYPRRKMVLTQPVELPPWGELAREEYQKEDLLETFERMVAEQSLDVRFGAPVERVERRNGHFEVAAGEHRERARAVILALGRRGMPRKLGVPGEELPKVMYRLLDAESYEDRRILVVGGGDSAAEAAIGLARQASNEVTLSYRREKIVRIKKKNQEALDGLFASGRVKPLFSSNVVEITPDAVILEVGQEQGRVTLPNDEIFVFAGGLPPTRFLEAIGVRMGGEDVSPGTGA